MIETIINEPLALPSNASPITFDETDIRTRCATCNGWLDYSNGNPNFKIFGNGYTGYYDVEFSASVSTATPGVVAIGLFQFNNPSGLYKTSDTLYVPTAASGAAMNEETNNNLEKSVIRQGYLEGSNVNVADEMVNMITTQRAYEFNSKIITTSDTMLGTSVHNSSGTLSIRSNSLNLFVTSTV